MLIIVRLCIALVMSMQVNGQSGVEFYSSDTALQNSFYRAKELALSYRGNPADPVGPWYEAALPSRDAFCVRDVSHQSIGAEILGMGAENKNMLTRFVSNISESKDWCTFWEINKYNRPASEDYRNDTAFWYNLNANFELIDACWRLYQWTGDRDYISQPGFKKFFDITVTDYINRWKLQADSLLKRPLYLNAPQPFNANDYFHRCRGLPSYYEARDDVRMGVDLVAGIYRAFKTYAAMATLWGDKEKAAACLRKAADYRRQLDLVWWNDHAQRYYTYYTNDAAFGDGEGATFLLWYDALKNRNRIRQTISQLTNAHLNVENLSYLPYQLCRYGYAAEAYRTILYLVHPATKRREYPEVSFGVIEGIVQGLMGVATDAATNVVTTLCNLQHADMELKDLPVLSARIDLKQWPLGSALTNNGKRMINWKAAFRGSLTYLNVNGKKIKTMQQKNIMGNVISCAVVKVRPGERVEITVR